MKKAQFQLKKIHVDKKLVVITYLTGGSDREKTEKGKESPHPDMKVALNEFRPIMAEMFEQSDSEQVEHDITGITLSEKKGKEQVLVSSIYTLKSNQKVAINGPNVLLEGEEWDNQGALMGFVKKVSDEAYAYLFEHKAAQLDLENAINEKEPELEL